MRIRQAIFVFLVIMSAFVSCQGKDSVKLAYFDESETEIGKSLTAKLTSELTTQTRLILTDADLNRTALKGLEINNLLNLSREEARNLGSAIGAEFILIAKADVWQRSSSQKNKYFEGFIYFFLFETRGGNALHFKFEKSENATERAAFQDLEKRIAPLADEIRQMTKEFDSSLTISQTKQRERFTEIEDVTEGVRTPLPFRRLRPSYTTFAALYNIEATVDALVLIDEKGDVQAVEIERTGGFGLDESVVETVKKMTFRPALRENTPFPARFILRYNFRRTDDAEK